MFTRVNRTKQSSPCWERLNFQTYTKDIGHVPGVIVECLFTLARLLLRRARQLWSNMCITTASTFTHQTLHIAEDTTDFLRISRSCALMIPHGSCNLAWYNAFDRLIARESKSAWPCSEKPCIQKSGPRMRSRSQPWERLGWNLLATIQTALISTNRHSFHQLAWESRI